ncbi:MAG: YihY/virulence factor BrkB family protein [Saprospiraceae bacterium]|nr:YihY/virulence factor BrkB family protein [Saprospiraceae bacterium]
MTHEIKVNFFLNLLRQTQNTLQSPKLFSFGLILSIAFLLMISLIISIVLAAASDFLKAHSSKLLLVFFQILNLIISLGVISFLFALMFKFLPDAKISWRQGLGGALLTGILFTR